MDNQSRPPEGGYDPTFFDMLADVEDRHFWFRARNRLILEVSQRISRRLEPGCRILEIGCGTGNTLRHLAHAYSKGAVFGMDLWREALSYARLRTACNLVQGDLRAGPFATRFDVIGMFDVLEHIQDDATVLRDVHRMLGLKGTLVVTVPAHQSLWSYFDESSRHCRRYSRRELCDKLNAAGYRIEHLTEFMACTFPLVWLTRRLAGLRGHGSHSKTRQLTDNEFRIVPGVNDLLGVVLGIEARWVAAGHSLPFGSSILAIARPRDAG